MIWFIIEIILLILLGNKMIVNINRGLETIKEDFYEYILYTIPFSIILFITVFTGYCIFNK